MTAHAWTIPDDQHVSECLNRCGAFRLLAGGRNVHAALYSRSRSDGGTWSTIAPPCTPEKKE